MDGEETVVETIHTIATMERKGDCMGKSKIDQNYNRQEEPRV